MNELPEGWIKCVTSSVAEVVGGATPKSKDPSNFTDEDGIPWLTPADLSKYQDMYISRGKRNITEKGYASCSTKLMPAGSVLFSSRAPIGYVVIAANQMCTNQGFKSFVPYKGINSKYLYYYLKFAKEEAELLASGTTFQEISGKKAAQIPMILAPENEQKRIANKLDQILEEVKRAKSRLDRIPVILKNLRLSIYNAATQGGLIETHASRKELTLQDLAKIIDPQPSHRTPKEYDGGIPYIGIGNIRSDGSFDLEGARKVSPDVLKKHNERYQVEEGDFIFGKIGTLGKSTPIPIGVDYTLSANVILIQPNKEICDPVYLRLFLQAQDTMEEITKQSNSTSQAAFGIKKMRAFKISLPNMKEQKKIVKKATALLDLVNQIEDKYRLSIENVDKVSQSVLDKAFRGELVPQDANDEHASVLVERIKAEKELQELIPKEKRRKVLKKNKEVKEMISSVLETLKKEKTPLTAQKLLQKSGYPVDSEAEIIEAFFLDIKNSLLEGTIIRERIKNEDIFRLTA